MSGIKLALKINSVLKTALYLRLSRGVELIGGKTNFRPSKIGFRPPRGKRPPRPPFPPPPPPPGDGLARSQLLNLERRFSRGKFFIIKQVRAPSLRFCACGVN